MTYWFWLGSLWFVTVVNDGNPFYKRTNKKGRDASCAMLLNNNAASRRLFLCFAVLYTIRVFPDRTTTTKRKLQYYIEQNRQFLLFAFATCNAARISN